LRLILEEHELEIGEVVVEELRGVPRKRFGMPAQTVEESGLRILNPREFWKLTTRGGTP